MSAIKNQIYQDSLQFHSEGKRGKLEVGLIKPLVNQRSLALAYSPGVAAPCLEIQKEKNSAYEYTSKGNFVAVISNGTAVLGLGNLGAAAAKPVMEGKAVLFKRFADIDSVDIEVDTENPDEFVNAVKCIADTWGGINLEDIKAPECFIIEKRLQELLDIPVFHDDQHGTAIVVAAGLINAAHITGRHFSDMKVVVNGAGAAAIACISLLKAMGLKHENAILCDTKGVIYEGRQDGMNSWKASHAVATDKRTLKDAVSGADVFLGLSVKGALNKDMVKAMNANPIIFAMANPDPEITPEDVLSVRQDAIIATGRSDYNNQVNNLMCFPYIFRGALDVQAATINLDMKIAAANAIASLAREEITEEVKNAYAGKNHKFGPEYIIPVPFDSRLIRKVPIAVAKAAMHSGVARRPIADFVTYERSLAARLDLRLSVTNQCFSQLSSNPKTLLLAATGNHHAALQAAREWCTNHYGNVVIIGDTAEVGCVKDTANTQYKISVIDPEKADLQRYVEFWCNSTTQKALTAEECSEILKRDKALLAALVLACNEADTAVLQLDEAAQALDKIVPVLGSSTDNQLFTLQILVNDRHNVLFLVDADASTSQSLATVALHAVEQVKRLGCEPRVAFIASTRLYSTAQADAEKIAGTIAILDRSSHDFEYDRVLASISLLKQPSGQLSKPANVLILPPRSVMAYSLLLQEFREIVSLGPILCGLNKQLQIVDTKTPALEILNTAAISAALA